LSGGKTAVLGGRKGEAHLKKHGRGESWYLAPHCLADKQSVGDRFDFREVKAGKSEEKRQTFLHGSVKKWERSESKVLKVPACTRPEVRMGEAEGYLRGTDQFCADWGVFAFRQWEPQQKVAGGSEREKTGRDRKKGREARKTGGRNSAQTYSACRKPVWR